MATVARGMASERHNVREVHRRHVGYIGLAPRTIVCFKCAHNNEVVLGRIDSDKPCLRCGKKLRQGVVVQAPASGRKADRSHRS